jgi:hypothetical protein
MFQKKKRKELMHFPGLTLDRDIVKCKFNVPRSPERLPRALVQPRPKHTWPAPSLSRMRRSTSHSAKCEASNEQ